jgi:hypothetical protein
MQEDKKARVQQCCVYAWHWESTDIHMQLAVASATHQLLQGLGKLNGREPRHALLANIGEKALHSGGGGGGAAAAEADAQTELARQCQHHTMVWSAALAQSRQVGRRYLMPVLHQLANRIRRLYQWRQQGSRRRRRARGGPIGVLGLQTKVGATTLSRQA